MTLICKIIFVVIAGLSLNLTEVQAGNDNSTIYLEVGKGVQIKGARFAESIFVSNPEIADIIKSPDSTAFIFGRMAGETNLIMTKSTGVELMSRVVNVRHPMDGMESMLKDRFPDENISIQASTGSLYLSGSVESEKKLSMILDSVSSEKPNIKVLNEIVTIQNELVNLHIKLIEVNHERAQRFGLNISHLINTVSSYPRSSFGINSTNRAIPSFLDNLITKGVASILTESNLNTKFGKETEFEVGGEIPLPSYSGNEISSGYGVDYKFVGIGLNITPDRIGKNKISLKINSSSSSTSPSSLSISRTNLPLLNSQRLNTETILSNGETAVLLGYFQNNHTISERKPNRTLLGQTLSRLDAGGNNSTSNKEIIITVTAHFDGKFKRGNGARYRLNHNPNILNAILTKNVGNVTPVKLEGSGGFLY